jgi:hypothetical protein
MVRGSSSRVVALIWTSVHIDRGEGFGAVVGILAG